MGLFKSIKNIFKKEEKKEENSDVKVYEEGLTKTRESFVSRLANLTHNHNKIDEEYFEELEDILIMADIGVNTVMSFIERLKKRVKHEDITDPEYLKEVIVDEILLWYFKTLNLFLYFKYFLSISFITSSSLGTIVKL